jgi:hypothetical protein
MHHSYGHIHAAHVYRTRSTCIQNTQQMCTEHAAHVYRTRSTCIQNTQHMYTEHAAHVYRTRSTCIQNTQHMYSIQSAAHVYRGVFKGVHRIRLLYSTHLLLAVWIKITHIAEYCCGRGVFQFSLGIEKCSEKMLILQGK